MEESKITIEKLEELEKKTKDKFTKLLINHLKRRLPSLKEIGLYEKLDFERITNLIKKEKNNQKLKEFRGSTNNLIYSLKIQKISHGKEKGTIIIHGQITLKKLSQLIQREFDLEPFHLYEFKIGKYKFGPECDEWQEIFDNLDNFGLDSAISVAGLNKGDNFGFLYDFGDHIQFKIKITDIIDGRCK